jgi:predicted transposase YdaD
MTRFAERFLEKGRLEGREEGREEGIGQGEARVLLRQLTLKFGPVPEPVRSRVESADAETLLRWSEQVLSADRLEDVVAG